jgi:cell division septal protein FtsQ
VSINGRSLSETKDQNTNGLPVVIDGSSIPVKVGDRVVSRDFVDFVLKLNDYFKDNKIEVEQIFVSETTSELNVKLKDGYIIKFNTSDTADSQIKSLAATLALIKSQNKKPSEYIDLRVTGKAFYK